MLVLVMGVVVGLEVMGVFVGMVLVVVGLV